MTNRQIDDFDEAVRRGDFIFCADTTNHYFPYFRNQLQNSGYKAAVLNFINPRRSLCRWSPLAPFLTSNSDSFTEYLAVLWGRSAASSFAAISQPTHQPQEPVTPIVNTAWSFLRLLLLGIHFGEDLEQLFRKADLDDSCIDFSLLNELPLNQPPRRNESEYRPKAVVLDDLMDLCGTVKELSVREKAGAIVNALAEQILRFEPLVKSSSTERKPKRPVLHLDTDLGRRRALFLQMPIAETTPSPESSLVPMSSVFISMALQYILKFAQSEMNNARIQTTATVVLPRTMTTTSVAGMDQFRSQYPRCRIRVLRY